MISPVFSLSGYRFLLWETLQNQWNVDRQMPASPEFRPHSISYDVDPIIDHLETLSAVEQFWGFPGPEILTALRHYATQQKWQLFHQLLDQSARSVRSSDAYFREWSPLRSVLESLDRPNFFNPFSHSDRRKPIVDILILHPFANDYSSMYRNALAGLVSDKDEFLYHLVFVDNATDGFAAMLSNPNIQGCVFVPGFAMQSPRPLHSKLADYSAFVTAQSHQFSDYDDTVIQASIIANSLRPEVDQFLITGLHPTQIDQRIKPLLTRIIYGQYPFQDLHFAILNGIRNRFSTPFFHALLSYSQKPKDVFHALPISQGKSVKDSIWISDLYSFYGKNVFMAETSSTQGGLDSLLDPKGAIKQAQDKAAISFGSDHTFFVTNGTSTANKIVMQATLNPGDIVLVASDCHKSIPYSIVLAGAFPIFFENTTFPEHDLVGPVELDHMIATLMDLKKSGDLHRVKLIVLTHCTFDGVLYDVKKVMTSLLAIKSDLIFHWDEAWFATGYFDPTLRSRCAAAAATELRKQLIGTSTQVRVYITQSTHKTLSSFRQGSMVHVIDDDYNPTRFVDAYRMHSTTSPNYQIIASLDVCRRQMDLEGFRLVNQSINLGLLLRHSIRHNPTLSQYFSVVDFGYDTPDLDIPIYPEILNRWHEKPFTVLPSRVTLNIKKTGMDGSSFRQLLISTYDIQVNKTSAHTVLFIITIGATEASVNHLLSALLDIANRLSSPPRTSFHDSQKTPITRHIHRAFRPSFAKENNRLCDLRTAYYSGMDNAKVTHVTLSTELIDALHSGITYVSAGFVTPYPPGFPVLIPGQIITSELATYLAQSKIKEIHGYHSETGLAVFRESYIESIQETINDD